MACTVLAAPGFLSPQNREVSGLVKNFRSSFCGKLVYSPCSTSIGRRFGNSNGSCLVVTSVALGEVLDPPRLVLDSMEELAKLKSRKVGITDKRWAWGLWVQALFPKVKDDYALF